MFIDPHAHLVCRTTDDYTAMAQAGCIMVGEPSFWAGFDRADSSAFRDYFLQLTEYEPKRAAQFGIKHYCWICINPKEAEDPAFAREVMEMIPEFLAKSNVLGIGEIGLNRNTANEILIMEEQMDLAIKYGQLVLIHTPHLEDKLKGTKIILDALKNRPELSPDRVLVDHCEEHTLPLVKDAGYWAGLTLYPNSKLNPSRAADILECYGTDRIWVNSACDWGKSDPLSVPKLAFELRLRGWDQNKINQVVLHNPDQFMQCSQHYMRIIP
jgi:predicted metal-dependent TIM-barrel fold hydrolase